MARIEAVRYPFLVIEALYWLLLFRIVDTPFSGQAGNDRSNAFPFSSDRLLDERSRVFKDIRRAIISCRRLIGRSSCLREASAFHRMLSRRGIASEITFGARLDEDEGFQAHAWLEMEGKGVFGLDPKNSYHRFK